MPQRRRGPQRIPRSEVEEIADAVRKAAWSVLQRKEGVPAAALPAALEVVACGSYRRGAADSSDVDVLLCRRDGGGLGGAPLLRRTLEALEKAGHKVADLTPRPPRGADARGACTYFGGVRLAVHP